MNIKLFTFGKTKNNYLLEGESEYLKRIRAWASLELVELKESKSSLPSDKLKEHYSEILLPKLPKNGFNILLEERGKSFNSLEFSKLLTDITSRGHNQLSFSIAGPWGWNDKAREKADLLLSLSQMTLPHELVRLLLLEQIYRAISISKNEPYHK